MVWLGVLRCPLPERLRRPIFARRIPTKRPAGLYTPPGIIASKTLESLLQVVSLRTRKFIIENHAIACSLIFPIRSYMRF